MNVLIAASPLGSNTPNPYQPLADQAWTIAHTLQKWNDERSVLLSLRASQPCGLSEVERLRLCDLNSSLDTYEVYMRDLGQLPSAAYITRAQRAA
ncbi:hypothetical protein SAMN05421770_102288 [Granulicella rosea]|uniref:Uncharacterized protein n=1 Tax=Granulicella rosea TaxID=474952 RepID=A0A239HC96_9BACT|nr:hypothetical protein SAMN05421770_102288 [Granulicella rosea]